MATAKDQAERRMDLEDIVTQFNTYEDFLDSQITAKDLRYLKVRVAALQSGCRLPVLLFLPSPSVEGFSPPGGGLRHRTFQTAAEEVNRRVLPAFRCLSRYRF